MQGQPLSGALHPLWREVVCLNSKTLFASPFTGSLSKTYFPAPPAVKGGILCDGECESCHLSAWLWAILLDSVCEASCAGTSVE